MMHRQLWLIITCTASRVTTSALLSIHTASRVYSIGLRSKPPKIQLGIWGSAVSSPSWIWDGAPAMKRFGAC